MEMKPGDIVAIHIKGGKAKKDPPQTIVFGVIQDDSLVTMSKLDARTNYNFPWYCREVFESDDYKENGNNDDSFRFREGLML